VAFVFSRLDDLATWAQTHSLSFLFLDLSCCGIEMMHTTGGRYDLERFGAVQVASPKQADLMIVAGSISYKYAETLKKNYEQMCDPKWVMAIGSCAGSGGMFEGEFSYSTVSGVDKILPVDVYVPGCPPRPEAIMHGLLTLQKGIVKCRAQNSWKDSKTSSPEL